MSLTLSTVFSNMDEQDKELNRAIAKIALLKGINTAERKKFAVQERIQEEGKVIAKRFSKV